jgi:hypothetical protein
MPEKGITKHPERNEVESNGCKKRCYCFLVSDGIGMPSLLSINCSSGIPMPERLAKVKHDAII